MKFTHATASIIGLAILSGCVLPTTITSNKSPTYKTEPKQIFVITDVGSEFGDEYFNAFQKKMTSITKDCGANITMSRITPLELDESTHLKKIKEFNADSIISIKRNGGTRDQYRLFHVIYDIKLLDVRSNKIIWRAETNFYRGGTIIPLQERGEALAIDITNKMKEDKLFNNCKIIKQDK